MYLIKVIGKERVKNLIEIDDERRIVYIAITSILKPKVFGKKTNVLYYSCLIPPATILESYVMTGDKDKYKKEYMEYLSRPQILFLINEIVHYAAINGLDIAFVCSLDEEEYGYIQLVTDFVSGLYRVKAVKAKKYMQGLKLTDNITIYDISNGLREKLIRKLRDAYIDPVKLTSRVLGMKNIGKNFKKKIKERIEE